MQVVFSNGQRFEAKGDLRRPLTPEVEMGTTNTTQMVKSSPVPADIRAKAASILRRTPDKGGYGGGKMPLSCYMRPRKH